MEILSKADNTMVVVCDGCGSVLRVSNSDLTLDYHFRDNDGNGAPTDWGFTCPVCGHRQVVRVEPDIDELVFNTKWEKWSMWCLVGVCVVAVVGLLLMTA